MIRQTLDFGAIHLEKEDEQAAPYILSGQRMFVLGTTNGRLDPLGAEHMVGEMGGVWAHPVKFADGWYPVVHDGQITTPLIDCRHFAGRLSDTTFHFEHGALAVTRTDFVAETAPCLFALLQVTNTDHEAWHGAIGMVLRVNIRPAWFSGWEAGQTNFEQEHGLVVGYDHLWHGRWGLAFGGSESPSGVDFQPDNTKWLVELRYDVMLAPGEQRRWEFTLAVDHQDGQRGARRLWEQFAGQGAQLLEAKRAHYAEIAWGGVQLHTPDRATDQEYALAKINLHMLYADYAPYMPGFLLAGVPEYPQLFGCDTAYSAAGATAAGFAREVKSSLSLLADRARMACGRVPHEITTNGRTFNPGNTQETPQFTLAVWDYVRWTGDLAFLREMYPICREGVMDYLATIWDSDRDGYPQGDAMVERTGMGVLKLDSACYLFAAWNALAQAAAVLGRPEAAEYAERVAEWRQHFEHDWWLPEQGLYADSLHSDYRPQFDGHWTQVVPVQLGIASPERATAVLDRLHEDFVNAYGLMHTIVRDRDERVWTLPTGLLALADLRYGRIEAAIGQLHNIALTTRNGMLGAFEELIPAGLCFMQLWSAAIYLQCVVEGFLGIDPLAHAHRLTICPALPPTWPEVTLRELVLGEHCVDISAHLGGCEIVHRRGVQPLDVCYVVRGMDIAAQTVEASAQASASLEHVPEGTAIRFELPPGSQAHVTIDGHRATIQRD